MSAKKTYRGFPTNKKCKLCNKVFKANSPAHIYCGNREAKKGCSYSNRKKYYHSSKYKKYKIKYSEKNTEKLAKLQSNWRKLQRELNTDYIKRQRALSRKYCKENKKKLQKYQIEYRKKNRDKILEYNRKRLLLKKNISGQHTKQEWEDLKKHNYNKCAQCGIKEKELKKIWKHTNFNKLTKDHIIPISLGGTDFIDNIQPLCISCNSSKKNNTKLKIGLTWGCFDIFHIGHLNLLQNAKKKCDILIVCISTDDYSLLVKGKKPIIPWVDRAKIVSAIRGVNVVDRQDSYFNKKEAILKYKPDILIVGNDWDKDTYSGEGLGVKVVYLPYTKHISSTKIRNQLCKKG